MMNVVGRQNRTKFGDAIVRPLIEAGLLEPTLPGKPKSRLQRYLSPPDRLYGFCR
jgi:hypothetical protein